MRRSDFLRAVGGAASWPLVAMAQAGKPPTIGFLGPLTQSAMALWTAAFVQRLRELGWIEGHTILIEYRWADGSVEHLADLVAEFVRLKVAVIVTGGSAAVIAAKQTTSVVPTVLAPRVIPFALDWLRHLRGQAATSPVCQISQLIYPASDLNCCAPCTRSALSSRHG